MDRTLIKQDNDLLKSICGDLRKFRATFAPVVEAFDQFEIGSITNDIFIDIIAGNHNTVIDNYRKSLSDHLDKTLVKNSTLKRIVLAGTEETIANFIRACSAFVNTDAAPSPYGLDKDRTMFLTAKRLSLIGGELCISDKTKEQLLESYCHLYVETEADHLIYTALLNMQASLEVPCLRWVCP
ncbi:hypothetical protein [Mucilaginibacter sp. UYCu711]|uniref:hypothetical protein n=1 Tax=Mucilaginibacter sp. UYCu711 TaxID=3156339 RepID=UPI003D1AD411